MARKKHLVIFLSFLWGLDLSPLFGMTSLFFHESHCQKIFHQRQEHRMRLQGRCHRFTGFYYQVGQAPLLWFDGKKVQGQDLFFHIVSFQEPWIHIIEKKDPKKRLRRVALGAWICPRHPGKDLSPSSLKETHGTEKK